MSEEVEVFLAHYGVMAHYGVKGMHWGVTKGDDSNAGNPALVAVAAVLAVKGGVYLVDSGEVHRAIIKGKAHINGETLAWKQKAELSKSMSHDELMKKVVKPINPDFGQSGTKMNCRRCTFAYEMRRRGLDVSATHSILATGQDQRGLKKAISSKGSPTAKLTASLWGEKKITVNPAKDFNSKASFEEKGLKKSTAIYDALNKLPDGARGELGVGWYMGGGHSVAWERVKGKTFIIDTQSGKSYDSPKAFQEIASGVMDAAYTRLDNVKLNDDFLLKWVNNK